MKEVNRQHITKYSNIGLTVVLEEDPEGNREIIFEGIIGDNYFPN